MSGDKEYVYVSLKDYDSLKDEIRDLKGKLYRERKKYTEVVILNPLQQAMVYTNVAATKELSGRLQAQINKVKELEIEIHRLKKQSLFTFLIEKINGKR